MRGGPEIARGHVAQVAELPPAVARGVLVPAGHGKLAETAVAAARAADHDVVAPVGQQLHGGRRHIRFREDAQLVFHGPHRAFRCRGRQVAPVVQIVGRGERHPLLKQQLGGLQGGIGQKTPLHGAFAQHAEQRKEAHALMVGHKGVDDRRVRAARQAQGRAVEGFVEPETAPEPA